MSIGNGTIETRKMTDEEWRIKVAQIEDGAAKYNQLEIDAKNFLDENAMILNDYWEEGIICRHCGKAYFLNMYNSGQLQLGKMCRNFYNHMIKIHNYKDQSFCQMMKFHIKEARYRTNNHISFREGDH